MSGCEVDDEVELVGVLSDSALDRALIFGDGSVCLIFAQMNVFLVEIVIEE